MNDVVLDDASASVEVGVMTVEKGSVILSVPAPGGGHTYQRIDNQILISMLKHLVNPLPGQVSNIELSISLPVVR